MLTVANSIGLPTNSFPPIKLGLGTGNYNGVIKTGPGSFPTTVNAGDWQRTTNPAGLKSSPAVSLPAVNTYADAAKRLQLPPAPVAEIRRNADPNLTISGKPFNEEVAAANVWAKAQGRVFGNSPALLEEWKDYTPEQMARVAANYKDHYQENGVGRDMWADLKNKFPEDTYKRLHAVSQGKQVQAAGKTVVENLKGQGQGPYNQAGDRALAELRELTPDQLRDLKREMPTIGTMINTGAYQQAFRNKAYKTQEANILFSTGDKTAASKVRIQGALADRDGAEAIAALRSLKPAERQDLVQSAGQAKLLESADKLEKTDQKYEARALINGRVMEANAAQLHGLLDNKDAFMARFGELTQADHRRNGPGGKAAEPPETEQQKRDREQMLKRYAELYNGETPAESFAKKYPKETLATDRMRFWQKGEGENRKALLNDALHGESVSLGDLKRSFSGLRPDEAKQLIGEYEKGHGRGTFAKNVDEKFSGTDEFKAAVAGEGRTGGKGNADQAQRTLNQERPSIFEGVTSTDDHAQRSLDRAKEAFAAADKARAAGDKAQAEQLTRRGEQLTRYAELDTDAYADRKKDITDKAAQAATAVAGTTAAVLTGGSVVPFLATVLTNEAVHRVGDGNNYNLNDAQKRVTDSAVSAIIPNVAQNTLTKVLPKGVISGGAVNTLTTTAYGVGSDLAQGKSLKEAAANVVTNAAGDFLQGQVVGLGRDVLGPKTSPARAHREAQEAPDQQPEKTRSAAAELPAKPVQLAVADVPAKTDAPDAPKVRAAADVPATPDTSKVRAAADVPARSNTPDAPTVQDTPGAPRRVDIDFEPAGDNPRQYGRDELVKNIGDALTPELRRQVADARSQREAKLAQLDQQIAAAQNDPTELKRLSEARKSTVLDVSVPEYNAMLRIQGEIHNHADNVVASAVKDGRIKKNDYEVKDGVSWKILEDLREAGVQDVLDFPGLKKSMQTVYDPSKDVTGKDAAARVPDGADPALYPDRIAKLKEQSDVINANRAIETNPARLKVGDHEVKLYNATDRDIRDASVAYQRIADHAPKVLTAVSEIHNTKVISKEVATYTQRGEAAVQGETGGVFRPSEPGAITVAQKAGHSSDQIYQKQVADGFVRAQERAHPGVDSSGIRALSEQVYSTVPAKDTPLNARAWTISHEAVHAFDRANGWVSEKLGVFGGSGKFSDESGTPTDYVTSYASHQPDAHVHRAEDFAETAAFIMNFEYAQPQLGPLSPALQAKLRAAGDAIGTNPDHIQRIINHYNR
jgi:hypothetical protein